MAFGFLKWDPDTFWTCTLTEFVLALAGHSEANGGEKKVDAPSDGEMDDLLKRYG